jgi:hypothetical protein
MTKGAAEGPAREEFESLRSFIAAHEAVHDGRTPTDLQTLERAVRLGGAAMRGVQLQLRRVRGSEPEDDEWLFRTWADFQFLIVALWQMRLAACLAASTNAAGDVVTQALVEFDRQLPALATMRHVVQHFDEYAVDHPVRRRQRKPGTNDLIGRRSLEVGAWSDQEFHWLGGTLDLGTAESAASRLYGTLRTTARQVRSG